MSIVPPSSLFFFFFLKLQRRILQMALTLIAIVHVRQVFHSLRWPHHYLGQYYLFLLSRYIHAGSNSSITNGLLSPVVPPAAASTRRKPNKRRLFVASAENYSECRLNPTYFVVHVSRRMIDYTERLVMSLPVTLHSVPDFEKKSVDHHSPFFFCVSPVKLYSVVHVVPILWCCCPVHYCYAISFKGFV